MHPSVLRHASETPLELLMHMYVQVAPPPQVKKVMYGLGIERRENEGRREKEEEERENFSHVGRRESDRAVLPELLWSHILTYLSELADAIK